eukprot:g47687.t1
MSPEVNPGAAAGLGSESRSSKSWSRADSESWSSARAASPGAARRQRVPEQRVGRESQAETGMGDVVLELTLEQLSAGTERSGGVEQSGDVWWTGVW